MNKNKLALSVLSLMTLFASCKVVGTIFKAGMWWGIFLVVIVIAVIIWGVSKFSGGNK